MPIFPATVRAEVGQVIGGVDIAEGGGVGEVFEGAEVDWFDMDAVATVLALLGPLGQRLAHVRSYIGGGAPRLQLLSQPG